MPNGVTFGPQITLGRLIELLERRPGDQEARFAFEYMHPTTLGSYRGFYEDLALSFSDEGDAPTVEQLLALLRAAVGTVFHGWKGGEYRATRDSPLWVARPGRVGSTAVTGITDCDWQTVITTEFVDC